MASFKHINMSAHQKFLYRTNRMMPGNARGSEHVVVQSKFGDRGK